MARSDRENGKLIAALAIGAAIVGVNFIRSRKTLRPMLDELTDMARQGIDNVRRDWSEHVHQATGGAEDLKGRPFWAAAGVAFASTFISACADEAKKQSERRAEKRKGPTLEEKTAAFNERFRHFRNHPQLIRGTPLTDAETDKKYWNVTDKRN